MSYRNEREEMRLTVPTYVEYRTTTEGLPQGFMIEQDGKKFHPRYYVDYIGNYGPVNGYHYFYENRRTLTFASFDEATAFILNWVAFLKWMNAIHPLRG